MKKIITPLCDAHDQLRATLTNFDYQRIDLELVQEVQEAHERAAGRAGRLRHEVTAPPLSNTGGKLLNLVIEGGEIKQVMERNHSSDSLCFIDWVNFTCHESSYQWGATSVTDEQLVAEVSKQCEHIFGFGITNKRDRGANFYRTSYELGRKYGLVCYGGQRNSVLVMLTGEGCSAAKHGWEHRLYEFLERATTPRITRIDLSYDDIEGRLFSMESLERSFDNGGFNNGGRNPDIELRGNWKNPNGKGRTLYVGSRTNGKFFRGYEKGCQLGDKESKWVRLEVEFKSVDRIVPHECLLRPSDYFAAAYPILNSFSDQAERILTIQKTVQISYDRTKEWLRHQCGSALNLMFQVEGDAKTVLDMVMREGKLPRGVEVPSWKTAGDYLHNQPSDAVDPSYIAQTFERY